MVLISLLLLPFNLFAHDFWMFPYQKEIRLCGGHDFPRCELAPKKNVEVSGFIMEELKEEELDFQRSENYLFVSRSEGHKNYITGFSLRRGGKVMYCGFSFVYHDEATKIVVPSEMVRKYCDLDFSITLKNYPFRKGVSANMEFQGMWFPTWSFLSEKGKKGYLQMKKEGILDFIPQEKGFYLVVTEERNRSISISIEVR